MQLHRDSTVSSLTVKADLEAGKVIWSDSPLVKAVKNGRMLVLDEVDKAPPEVVGVLKQLVERGSMTLSDGRSISPGDAADETAPNSISTHPDFAIVMLANRPGYPFHGNDFFASLGTCMRARFVHNPDPESERGLLKGYAPDVSDDVIERLVRCFEALRGLAVEGDISYPYSTREAIEAVKHYSKYPEEGLVSALDNVLDYDKYDEETWGRLAGVFRENGIPVSLKGENRKDATFNVVSFEALPEPIEVTLAPSTRLISPLPEVTSLSPKKWNLPSPTVTSTPTKSSRIDTFTHEVKSFSASPPGPYGKAVGMVCRDGSMGVLTTGPVALARYSNPVVGSSTKTVFNIEDGTPFYLPTSVAPLITTVDGGEFVFFPSGPSYVFVGDGGDVEYGTLPDPQVESSSFSLFGRATPKKKEDPLKTPYYLHQASSTSVIYYQENSTEVTHVDVKANECVTYNLPVPISTASASSPNTILVALQSNELATLSSSSTVAQLPPDLEEVSGSESRSVGLQKAISSY